MPDGSIIDPWDKAANPNNVAQPCPLLSGLWEMGAPALDKYDKAKSHHLTPKDSVHSFDHHVPAGLPSFVNSFYEWATFWLFVLGDCHDLVAMPKDVLKGFMLSWSVSLEFVNARSDALTSMLLMCACLIRLDVLEQNVKNERNGKGNHSHHGRRRHKYLIEKATGQIVLGDTQEMDADLYYFCRGVHVASGYLDEDHFQVDATRDRIEKHFDDWYAKEVHPRKIALHLA